MKRSDNISINDLDEEIESKFMRVNSLSGWERIKALWGDEIQILYYLDKPPEKHQVLVSNSEECFIREITMKNWLQQ